MNPYYQPANKMPLVGSLLVLLGGVVAATVLALMYIYAIWYIPFVYVNVLVCLAFEFLLGVALRLLVQVGKLRNPSAVGWLALAVGLVALYLEWTVYLTLLASTVADTGTTFTFNTFVGLLTHPGAMWELVH
ncbi:MAG: hypothetical protein ACRYFX_09205 [Janthinobacterium lividum]